VKLLGDRTLLIRIPLAVILLAHSVPGMVDGGVNDFGDLFLNNIGFAPFGILIAWVIKASHVVCAVLLLLNKYIKAAAVCTIFILVMGIVLIHWREGWFVVGGGRNGIEYNFLMVFLFVYLFFDRNIQESLK